MQRMLELEKQMEEDDDKPEYDWEDTEDMSKYSCDLYDRYVADHKGIFGKFKRKF